MPGYQTQENSARVITADDVRQDDATRKAGYRRKHTLPGWFHRCRTIRSGTVSGVFVERCACGGTRMDSGPWVHKNENRIHRLRARLRGGR